MARLSGTILSDDESFKAQLGNLLRLSSVPVLVADGGNPDIAVVDGRGDVSAAVALVERLRAADATTGIFFVASDSNPDAILRSMRAGANEFFTWPPAKEALDEGIARTAGRRATTAATQSTTMVFFGAKGGAGTTTMAVNSAVEISRLSKRPTVIVDL
jgi:pilus assembly protein CpaE